MNECQVKNKCWNGPSAFCFSRFPVGRKAAQRNRIFTSTLSSVRFPCKYNVRLVIYNVKETINSDFGEWHHVVVSGITVSAWWMSRRNEEKHHNHSVECWGPGVPLHWLQTSVPEPESHRQIRWTTGLLWLFFPLPTIMNHQGYFSLRSINWFKTGNSPTSNPELKTVYQVEV